MDEVRTGDVLRLFFKKSHKHYLVTKVGKKTIKLKNENGVIVVLHHVDGLLNQLGETDITGFEILRDPNRYSQYKLGAEVQVHFLNGETFKGEIVENDDGLLKIKNEVGEKKFADLDGELKVEMLDPASEFNPLEVNLPDSVTELFFMKIDNSKRLHEWHATPPEVKPAPSWVVPVLDRSTCVLDILTDDANEEFVNNVEQNKTLPRPLQIIGKEKGKKVVSRTECVVFDQNVYGDKSVEAYTYVAIAEETVPIIEYAVAPLNEKSFQRNFIHTSDKMNLLLPQKDWARYDTEKKAETCAPEMKKALSAFDLEVALYPLPIKFSHFDMLQPTSSIKKRTAKPGPPPKLKKSRYTLAAAYNGQIPEELSTSETLARMLALDEGEAYFETNKSKRKTLHRKKTTDKGWAVERLGQKVKLNPSKYAPYPADVIGVINTVLGHFCNEEYAKVVAIVQQYGRGPQLKEDQDYLYFSPPLFSKHKFIPVSMDVCARMKLFRGKKSDCLKLKEEGDFLVDPKSGVVFSKVVRVERAPFSLQSFEQNVKPNFSEEDLIILNLARKLAKSVGATIKNENNLLSFAKLDCAEPYNIACGIGAFIAHHGNIPVEVVATTLKSIVKRKIWAKIYESKNLTEDIRKASTFQRQGKEERKSKSKENQKETKTKNKFQKEKSLVFYPVLEHAGKVEPVLKPHPQRQNELAVFTMKKTEDYTNLVDIFAPESTALPSLAKCTPFVMAILAPAEKSFLRYLGGSKTNDKVYEFIVNLTSFVPTFLSSNCPNFETNFFPARKKKTAAFTESWTSYYSPLLTLDRVSEENHTANRFAQNYTAKAPIFRKLAHVARQALYKADEVMLEACAVRAAYLHLEPEMSDEMESYIKQIVRACVHMYRF